MNVPDHYMTQEDLGPTLEADLCFSIDQNLMLLASELNKYLKALFVVQEDLCVVSSLVNFDGSISPNISNKVVITFLTMNVEQTSTEKLQVLEVLISANFPTSLEATSKLSAVADFFQFACLQGKAVSFESDVNLSIVKLDKSIVELAEIFRLLGANYTPSLVYRVAKPLYSITHSKSAFPIDEDKILKETIEAKINSLLMAFAFRPNTYPTWLAIRYLVDDYLCTVWKAGKLVGEKQKDAYHVDIGLGKTMTPDDILNGCLVLNIRLLLNKEDGFLFISFTRQLPKT